MCADRAGRPAAGESDPVADAAREPDYRMSLAAERTYLAYLRTGLALVAAGVAIAAALPGAGVEPIRRGIGAVLVVVGGAVLTLARPRWAAIDRAMRHSGALPGPGAIGFLGFALAAVGVACLVVALTA